MQAITAPTKEPARSDSDLPVDRIARDLYALITFLHKTCQSDVFEAVGALELTITQIKVLHHLEQTERPLSVKEAAELVSLSLPAASRAVDDLVRRGFAERHEDVTDRRMKRVSITDPGLAAIRKINAARLSGLEEFAHTLTAPERTKLVAALARLLQRPEVAACRLEDR